MKLSVYAIYDDAARAFATPFFMHNDGLAIRAFMDNVNSQEENNLSKHPDQFTLYKIAEWDDNAGELVAMDKKSLGNGLQFVTPSQKELEYAELYAKVTKILDFVSQTDTSFN